MTFETQRFQQHRWLPVLLLFLFLTGCSSSGGSATCYPLKGTVLYQKQPLEEAQITLHPVSGTITPLPTAITNKDGSFVVTTWSADDGAPEGDYTVTVTWKQLVLQGEEKTRSGKNLLPAIYSDPKRTPLKCKIQAGENQPLKLEITP